MLESRLCAEVAPELIKQTLVDNCDHVEKMTYRRHLSSNELDEIRVQLEKVCIELSDLEQKKKDYMDALKISIDPLKKEHSKVISQLKDRTVEIEGNCYAFFDEETRKIGYYDPDGNLVYSRAASDDEMQKTVQMELRSNKHYLNSKAV